MRTIAIILTVAVTSVIAEPLTCGSYSENVGDYRGTIATTRSGRKCQNWNSQTPHRPNYSTENYPNSGLEENFCRNPSSAKGAWCYTEDENKRWEYCDVPVCDTTTECGSMWIGNDFAGQKFYRGTINKTVSGRECQRWDEQSPHEHSRTFDRYPLAGLDDNYCRNSDGEPQTWCYTKDPEKRWEYCDVPVCDTEPPQYPSICYDYSEAFQLGPKECTKKIVYNKIDDIYDIQKGEEGAINCEGNVERDLMGLTRTTSIVASHEALQELCNGALKYASDETSEEGWDKLQSNADINIDDFFKGDGFLNEEYGNFQQEEEDFIKRGGRKRFVYMGNDSRLNDYLSTTEKSYQGGKTIMNFYNNEATFSFLSSPTSNFNEESCSSSNTYSCCWHRDRQYFDNNGDCSHSDCAFANPGDNTDLCWTDDNGEVYPYPEDETEEDLHCHGFTWGIESDDINTKAKWNNLFFISMYDHLYQRGYVGSITDDPAIAGEQAMCGCVEDMNPVARADCTEVIGRVNYTVFQEEGGGPLSIQPVPDTFYLEFQACQGYDYVEDFGPEDFAENPNAAELETSNNDLAAYVFRLYLEGKLSEDHVATVEETIIGYRDPSVNNSDEEREAACKAAFERKYPDAEYTERELPPTSAPTKSPTVSPTPAKEDDEQCVDGTLAYKENTKNNCKWLGKKGNKIEKFCKKKGEWSDGVKIFNICQMTCASVGLGPCAE